MRNSSTRKGQMESSVIARLMKLLNDSLSPNLQPNERWPIEDHLSALRYLSILSWPVNMGPDYKSRKEAFVSNLSGGSILEINTVTLVAPVSFEFFCASFTSLTQCTDALQLNRPLFFSGRCYNPDSLSSHPTVPLLSSPTSCSTSWPSCSPRPSILPLHGSSIFS